MNRQMFIDKVNEIGIPELMIQAIITEDDIGAVLRIHLLCEQLSEAWICSACEAENFFGEGDFVVRMNCSDKFKLTRNLGIPAPLYSCLKIINKIRNGVAHRNDSVLITNESIDSLINILRNFNSGNPSDNLTIDAPLRYMDSNGLESRIHSVYDDDTPNRIKLFICFSFLMSKLIFSINNE